MDFVRTAVSYITFQRFYRYLLKRILGGFIIPDFSTDQLDIQVYKGEVQLLDAAIDSRKLNELLNQAKIPFRVKSGFIARIRIHIPWRNILHEKCKVFVSGVQLDIVNYRAEDHGETVPPQAVSSPQNSSTKMSESARALTRLVRQVLMNVEGCVENLTVRLVSNKYNVYLSYHISTVLLHQGEGENKIKRFDVGMTSLIAHTLTDRFQLLTSHPGTISLNIVDPQVVAVNTNLSSLNITLDSADSFQVIQDLLNPSSSSPYDDDIFFPALEPELDVHPGPRGPWYEEMYSVLESEVLGDEGSVESDPSEIVLEESGDVQEKKFVSNFNITNFSLSLFSLNFDFRNFHLVIDPRDSVPLSVSIHKYQIGLSDDLEDTVSVSSFNSALDEEEIGTDLEGLLFDNQIHSFTPPSTSNPGRHSPKTFFTEHKYDSQSIGIQWNGFKLKIGIFHKVVLNLNSAQIFDLISVFDRIPRSTNPSDSSPFTVEFSDGITVRMNTGIDDWMQVDFIGSVVVDSQANDVIVVREGMRLSCNDSDCDVITNRFISVRIESETSPTPVDIVDPDHADDEENWTALSVPCTSIMRGIFGHNRKPAHSVLDKMASPPRAESSSESPNNGGSDLAETIMKKCQEQVANELIVDFGHIDIARKCSGKDFVEFQIKLQSLIDQLSAGKRSSPNGSPIGLSILAESLAVGPFVELSQIGCRVILGSPSTMIGLLAKNAKIQNISRSNYPLEESIGLRERFEKKNSEAVTVSIDVSSSDYSSRINLMVSLKVLNATVSPSPEFFAKVSEVIDWFVPPINLADPSAPLIAAPPRPTYTVYIIRLSDCVIEWKSVKTHLPETLIDSSAIVIEKLEICSGILSTVDATKTFSGISINGLRSSLWLAKQVWSTSDCFSVSELREHGYRQLVSVSEGSAVVKSKERKLFIDLHFGSIRCDVKPDSFVGLISFLTCAHDLMKMRIKKRVDKVEVLQPPKSPVSHPFNFSINENFLHEKTKGGRGGSRFRQELQIPDQQPSSGSARWLVDPATVSVVYDHLTSGGKSKTHFAKRKAEELVDINHKISLSSISLKIDSVRIYFIDGLDWSGNEFHLSGLGNQFRPTQNCSLVCFEFDRVDAAIVSTRGPPGESPESILGDISITSSEVRIRDGVVGSVYQSVVCPKILEDDSSPGDFLQIHLWSTGQDDSLITKGEVSIQPVSVSIDQDTMDFMQKFVRDTTVAGVAEEELDESREDESETSVVDELIVQPIRRSCAPLFQSLAISPISLEMNYRSKRLSLSRLRQGDVLQFLNLVPMIEGVRLCLREVRLVDVVDGSELGKRLVEIWSQDTKKSKLMKSISHVTPVRSFTNLSFGVKELINQPRKQMKRKDGNLGRGVLRGVSMFVKTLTIESLNLIDSVVSSAQGALEFAGGSSPTRVPSVGDEIEDEDEILEWTSVEKGARERELDPSSAIETLYSGTDALVRGVRTTIQGDSGVSGFFLRPAIGATQAVSVVLRGARSTLDSGKHRAETERKYKAPYTREEMMGN